MTIFGRLFFQLACTKYGQEEDIKMIKVMISNDQASENRDGELYKMIIQSIEKPLIESVLARTEGNQLKAARILGINRNTMRSKIKKLCIDAKRWKA
jgi:Factor for inversion stimulation Fis, transcriptional activator